MPACWNDLLPQKVTPPRNDEHERPARLCLVGVGSDLRGDDSAGLWVACGLMNDRRATRRPDLMVLEGGSAPENQTGAVRAFQPDLVLLVDAADLDEPPGMIRWIPLEEIDGVSASSHSLPLSMLAGYLAAELGCEVAVLGIQPGQNEFDSELSPTVRAAVDEIRMEVEQSLTDVMQEQRA